jgi:D-tyrosyl-tRNA(Tyr) deacylase
MRVVVQRVNHASVRVNSNLVGEIQSGLLILLGVTHDDTDADIGYLVSKLIQLRIFGDHEGKMNLSITDSKGDFLVVSQFTLYASTKKGNRPGYVGAARPEVAIPLYERFIQTLAAQSGLKVATGVFGADMKVSLENDGPVTIIMDSKIRE